MHLPELYAQSTQSACAKLHMAVGSCWELNCSDKNHLILENVCFWEW